MESLDEVVAGTTVGREGDRQGRRGRRGLLLLVPVLLCVLGVAALAGCGGPAVGDATGSGPAATPREGGTYNYPIVVEPRPFDPGLIQLDGGSAGGCAVLHQLYEGLVRWELQSDGTLKTVPCLAESWSANADCTVWIFNLRHGVKFQAPVSREVTATDVVRDLRYLADPASVKVMQYFAPEEKYEAGTEMSIWLRDIAGTDANGMARPKALGVKALDRYTVRFTLKGPYSEFPDTLGHPAFWVWPADHRQKVGAEAYSKHPVGTGPYQFLQRAYGRSIDLTRNPNWWDTSGGPYLDRIHYEVYANAAAMLLAFREGVVDWARIAAEKVDQSRALPEVTTGHWTVESVPLLLTFIIEINMRDPVVGGSSGLPLRQALTYGCDRQVVVDALREGGLMTTGLVPPGIPGSGQVRGPYAYDAAKADELYGQAGSPTLELAYPTPYMRLIAEGVLASYAKTAMSIRGRGMAQEPFWKLYLTGKLQSIAMGWGADYPSMDNFLYPMFHSGQSTNSTSYSNQKVDDLLDKARATRDAEVRRQIYAEAERAILADAPVVPLYHPTESRLLDTRVLNVNFDPMGSVDLWRAWVK